MRLGHHTQVGVAVVAVMWLTALFYGCNKVPSEPDSEPGPVMGYAVYFWEGDTGGKFYRYYPKTGTLDSVTVSPSVLPNYEFSISGDGKRMYIDQGLTIAVVDLNIGSVITELPYATQPGYGVHSSPDNSMIAIQSPTSLRILDAQSFELLFEDTTLNVRGAWFTPDSQRLYCSGAYQESDAVIVIDIANDFSVTPRVFDPGGICRVRPTLDEKTWYLLRHVRSHHELQVYDVESDSVIFKHQMLFMQGEMEMTPDGRYVFLNDASDGRMNEGPSYFTVFDLQNMRVEEVSTIGIADGINPKEMAIGDLVVTPDGKWLVAGEAIRGDSFLRFNIETMEIDSYTQFHSPGLGTFACQVGQ